MTKTKRNLLIFCITIGGLAVIAGAIMLSLYLIFTHDPQTSGEDARRIALEDFGMDEVLVVTGGSPHAEILGEYADKNLGGYIYYVLGVKDGKEMMIVVPHHYKDGSHQIDWPLQHSFTECIAALNEYAGTAVCEKDDYACVDFYDFLPSSTDYGGAVFDTPFALIFEDSIIGENEGQIVISRRTPSGSV